MNAPVIEGQLTRRRLLAAGGAGALTLLAGCGSGARSAGGWSFADDRGHTLRLKQRPTRIVAYTSAAAALHDWGVTPVGVFGDDPREDPSLAGFPWHKAQIVGSVYGEIDTDALKSLKADLIVSRWYPPPDDTAVFGFKDLAQEKAIGSQVPIVAMNGHAIATRENNLRIIAVSADQKTLYVSTVSGDLAFYAQRGVPLVRAKTSDPYWDALPWKRAGKYAADAILYDARSDVLPLVAAKGIPEFAELPAVRANQISMWQADPPPSYQRYTTAMNGLARAMGGWRKVT